MEAARAARASLVLRLHDDRRRLPRRRAPAVDRELGALEAVDLAVVSALRGLVRRAIEAMRGVFAIAD